MKWDALTNFNKIGIGTSFLLIESPTIADTAPSHLFSGATVTVVLNDGNDTHLKSEIIRLEDGEADIRLPDGSVWRMTPHISSDYPVGITADWANRQAWVVRSKV